MHFVRTLIIFCITFFIALETMSATGDISFDFRQHIFHRGPLVDGWLLDTAIRLPFSFSHSQSRVGVSSGTYLDITGKLKVALHSRRGPHDWSSGFFIAESYSMSPTIPNRFVKTLDLLRLETRYLYEILPWLGFFIHGRMETSMFEGVDLHDTEKQFEMRNVDNSVRETLSTKEVKISDPFKPLFFQENIGLVAGLVQQNYFTWEAKAAFSLRQTLAGGQRVFVEEANGVRVVRDLRSFYQLGPAAGTSIRGKFYDDKISYAAGIDVTWPAWQRPKPQERSFLRSLIIEGSAGISFKLVEWASIEYLYTVARIPDILEAFQQNHAVNLTLGFDWLYQFGTPAETI